MGARGEGVLLVDGREVRVLFTNRALARAETALGKTVLDLTRGVSRGDIGVNQVAELLRAGIEAAQLEAGNKPTVTLDDAYEVMDAVGFPETARVVLEAFTVVMNYRPGADAHPPA